MTDTRRIYKYPIDLAGPSQGDLYSIEMPQGAEVLYVGYQEGVEIAARENHAGAHQRGEVICLWALVDPTAPPVVRGFHVFGTGNPIPDEGVGWHVGSVQAGPFVWHVFEGGGRA